MTTETIDFAAVVDKVVNAMEAAISEYGADAVDLAMMAYQVEAIKLLLIGFASALPLLMVKVVYRAMRKLTSTVFDSDDDEVKFGCFMATMIYSVITGIMFLVGIFDFLANPVTWLAAFGRPELLIATKALQAAGLM